MELNILLFKKNMIYKYLINNFFKKKKIYIYIYITFSIIFKRRILKIGPH